MAVYNLAGAVEIVPGAGGDVVVEVRRGGSDGGTGDIQTTRVDRREALVIRYSGDRIG